MLQFVGNNSLQIWFAIACLLFHPAIQPSSHPAIQPSSHPAIRALLCFISPLFKSDAVCFLAIIRHVYNTIAFFVPAAQMNV